jgi:multidrug efflux pump subunit AcrA (membrane-fusion protein)
VLFLLLPIVLIVGAYFYFEGGEYMSTNDAYIQADQVGLSTDVSGMVKSVDVKDNQQVKQGDVLFQLDPQPFQLKLNQAEAQLGVVRDNFNALKQNYQSIKAQIDQAQAQVWFNQRQYERQEILEKKGFAAKATLDQARVNLQNAEQSLASLQHQLAGIVANLGGKPDIPLDQYPEYRQALAARNEAARELRDTVVRAPFSGTVTNVPALRPGMYLPASTTGFYLRYQSGLGPGPAQRDRADLCSARGARHGNRRQLSRADVARQGTEHRSGGPVAVFLASRTEYEWQLGQGRPAHPDAGKHRSKLAKTKSTIAFRDECRSISLYWS